MHIVHTAVESLIFDSNCHENFPPIKKKMYLQANSDMFHIYKIHL